MNLLGHLEEPVVATNDAPVRDDAQIVRIGTVDLKSSETPPPYGVALR